MSVMSRVFRLVSKVLGHRADHKTPSTNGRDPRGTSQKIVMKRRELPKDPTSSRRKAIILEVGTLGHILLTSSLGSLPRCFLFVHLGSVFRSGTCAGCSWLVFFIWPRAISSSSCNLETLRMERFSSSYQPLLRFLFGERLEK